MPRQCAYLPPYWCVVRFLSQPTTEFRQAFDLPEDCEKICWLSPTDPMVSMASGQATDSTGGVGMLGAVVLFFGSEASDYALDCFFYIRPPPLRLMGPLLMTTLDPGTSELGLKTKDVNNPSGGRYVIDRHSELLKALQ